MSSGCSSPEPPRPAPGASEAWRAPRGSPVRVVEDAEELLPLERAWNAHWPANGHPLRQFHWVRACAETLADDGELRVFVSERAGRLEAVAPLVERDHPTLRLEMLGARELHAPCELLYASGAALATLVGALADTGMAVALDGFAASSPMRSVFEEAYRDRGCVRAIEIDPMPYIELDAGWTRPEQRLDPGLCSDMQRVLREAEYLGGVAFDVLAPRSCAELGHVLEEVKGGPSPWTPAHAVSASRRGRFLRRYTGYAADNGVLRVVLMRIGGHVVGVQLAVVADQRYWVLHICYDDRFARFLPGMLLTVHAVGHAASHGLRSYEFLGEPEVWAKRFTDRVSGCRALRSYPLNATGYAALCSDNIHPCLGAGTPPREGRA